MSHEPMINSDDVGRLRKGDQDAFRLVYDRFYRKVYQFAYAFLKNKEQSEEIVQETFLSLWTSRDKLDETLPIHPYLFTIARRLVLDTFRKGTSTQQLRDQLFALLTEYDNHTEEIVFLSDLMRFTENAISELPKQQQLIFRLSRFDGLSHEEIAERLNISKNTVKNHLVAALKTLRRHFDYHGITYLFFVFFLHL
ncbi:RNA polymerase sigma factor [Pedobacter sp. BS3]|uniref:RNA polymerase sigma factor n=1 Tax=Pedobacter sp. BS3 TaxID=2567937 RepID=UPI001F5B1657|nr:RNA polymerase sigma-70 factor [Pedobacter sp. BS3]